MSSTTPFGRIAIFNQQHTFSPSLKSQREQQLTCTSRKHHTNNIRSWKVRLYAYVHQRDTPHACSTLEVITESKRAMSRPSELSILSSALDIRWLTCRINRSSLSHSTSISDSLVCTTLDTKSSYESLRVFTLDPTRCFSFASSEAPLVSILYSALVPTYTVPCSSLPSAVILLVYIPTTI
jgi:hypothetical protein